MPILQYPNPLLSAKNEHIDFSTSTTDERIALLKKLNASLKSQTWGAKLGIAAPQIGIQLRACIVYGIPMFNPEFTAPKEGGRIDVTESCYSLPKGDQYKVDRAKYGWLKWYDVNGVYHEEKVHDIKAIVAQHEIGHLDGICCNTIGEIYSLKNADGE